MLRQLRDQTRRIEQVATAEHDILKDAHPQIGEIRDAVEQLAAKK